MCVRAGVRVGEGGSDGVKILCLSPEQRRQRDTDVREQKFPREKRANSAHFSASHHETQFVRASVFNWLRILTSLHTFFVVVVALNPWTSAVRIMTVGVQMG